MIQILRIKDGVINDNLQELLNIYFFLFFYESPRQFKQCPIPSHNALSKWLHLWILVKSKKTTIEFIFLTRKCCKVSLNINECV